MYKLLSLLVISFFLFPSSTYAQQQFNYLALGDSYTIGESVAPSLRWPVQLVDSLNTSNKSQYNPPQIIARTGWTTSELQKAIEESTISETYDLVSLLIGVNNQYRGYDIELYRVEFRALLEKSIYFAGNDTSRVFVVSIPNYGVTPFGIRKGEEKIRKELLEYDKIAEQISSEYGIPFVNITPISERAKTDSSLIANDQLHPSGKMYSEWVHKILPVVKFLLSEY
tara:strand:+ start:5586 stop:6263 length:678 start_codon:yes stop_codon:yes gene_type:complete